MKKRICAAVVGLVLATSACTGSDDDPARADDTSTPKGASSTGAEPDPGPSVPPATGDLLEQASATMNAPDGYTHMPDMADYLDSAGEDEGIGVVGLGEDPGWTTGTLAEAASTTRRSKPFRPLPERLDDVELDGERAFHLSGAINAYSVYDEFGALRNGNFIHVEFRQSKSVPAAERQRLIESALASFRWR